jgi:hypothetical protein
MHRATGRLREFLYRMYGPRPLVGIAVVLLTALVGSLFWDWITQEAIPYVVGGMKVLLGLPIGFFGAVLVGTILVLAALAFVDTSPTAAVMKEWLAVGKKPRSRPLGEADRALIQPLRTVWNRHGQIAAACLNDLFRDVAYEMKRKAYWAELLDRKVQELEAGRQAMSEAVSDSSTMQIDDVRLTFNEMYAAYLGACRWLARIDANDVKIAEGPHKERLEAWRRLHHTFHDKLADLLELPLQRGSLKIWLLPGAEEGLVRFLGDAEGQPEEHRSDAL